MSSVYVGVLALSKVSWPAFLSWSIVIVCVHEGVTACLRFFEYFCVYEWV